jgi:hypothetical protein
VYIYKIHDDYQNDEGFYEKQQEYVYSEIKYTEDEFKSMCSESYNSLKVWQINPKRIKRQLINLYNFKDIDEQIQFCYYKDTYHLGHDSSKYEVVSDIKEYIEKMNNYEI